MKILRKLKGKITNRITFAIVNEIERRNQIRKKETCSGFKSFGPNSFFWGKEHFITGKKNFEIGENVHINENAFIRAEGGVIIGDNTHISRNLVLYSINHDYQGGLLPYDDQMVKKKVIIGKNVWIGMNVCIVPGTNIGDGCIIGMGTTVSGNIPPLSIVGSAKCMVIGTRDTEHYNYLENKKMYGGINGELYNSDKDKSLDEVGDIYRSRRSNSELILYNGSKAVKKTYLDTADGKKAYLTESEAYTTFQKYKWCPQIFEKNANTIIMEYFPSETRLDKIKVLDHAMLEEILWNVLDIFNEGFAHCDLHAKNIFVTENGIKIIDFESMMRQPVGNFFQSYDIIGEGLESPFRTNKMCIFSSSPKSISSLFKLKSIDELKNSLNNRFKKQMLDSSITFQSLRKESGRHSLQSKNIYSTFDLKNLKVNIEEGQRNTEKRFANFKIDQNSIENKTILDIGSNIGGTLLGLAKYNPAKMIGIEYDIDKVSLSNKVAKYNDISNVNFISMDIEDPQFLNEFQEEFDVVFCLAVIEHLNNKQALFTKLSKVCKSTLYFEGNSGSDIEFIIQELKSAGFINVQYLGNSDDEDKISNNVRPLFIVRK